MSWQPTDKQKQAIDGSGTLLVSAAAGSGKTAVLVERVVRCVLDPIHPVDINRLLVVTFTNAAAAEMKERIRKRFADEYAVRHDPRLLRQQMLLEKANISTIDAFCKSLVIEHFGQLDISPDFKLISEGAESVLRTAAMEETLNHFLGTQREDFSDLIRLLGAEKSTKAVETAIQTIYKYVRSLPFPQVWMERVRSLYRDFTAVEDSPFGEWMFARAERRVGGVLAALDELLPRAQEDPVVWEKRGEPLALGRQQLEAVFAAIKNRRWDETVSLAAQVQKPSFQGRNLPSGYDSPCKALTADAQARITGTAAFLQSLFSETAEQCAEECRALAPAVDLLLCAVTDYGERLDQKKAAMNAKNFSDVEYDALRLLVTLDEDGNMIPTPHARAICEAYDTVMVDEYQDVNDLQATIFRAVSHGKNNLFTVGDLKQSIYRFRKANPRNFSRLLREYPAYDGGSGPAKIILDGNFRSRPAICDMVNRLFGLLMSDEVGELTYNEEHRLTPMGKFAPPALPPVQLDFLTADGERAAIPLEADRIAAHIRQAMATPCVSAKDENENPTLRQAEYRDCVILLRGAKGRAEQYAARLREHGIPVVCERDTDLLTQWEVRKILALLRVIDNPTDDVSLLSCMLSPMFGFTADTVAAIRKGNRKEPLYLSVERAAQEGDPGAVRLMDLLTDLRAYAATVAPDRLLLRIYDRYGFLSAVQAMENGDLRKANLLALLSVAKECAENGFDRLDGLIRYLRKMEENGEPLASPDTNRETNAVRIMSIHHAKGLQFPICFLAGCGNSFNTSDESDPILLDEQLGLGLTLTDDRLRVRHSSFIRNAVLMANQQAGRSEELRILYVALTRAVDRLVALTTDKDSERAIRSAMADLAAGQIGTGQAFDPEWVLSASTSGKYLLYFALLHPKGAALRAVAPADAPLPLLADGDLTVDSVSDQQIPLPAPACESADDAPWTNEQETALAALRERLDYENPYAPLFPVFSKRSVSDLVHGESQLPPVFSRPAFLQQDGMSAAEKGTALHQFMQYADYAAAARAPEEELARLVDQAFLTEPQARCVDRTRLTRFFEGALYRRMAAAPRLWREHRFMSAVPVTELDPDLPARFANETVVVQGIADCVFEEDGALVVVDYKTDRVGQPQELVERYHEQLRLYARMLTDTMNRPVKELLIYSFSLNAVVPVPLSS